MKAYRMTVADIEELPHHPANTITKNERIKALELLDEEHERNRGNPKPLGWGNFLVSGLKGEGKSTFATMLAALVYASGYRVVHNASLLFAWRVDDMDMIRLGETTEVNMMAVIDELHIHSNRYAQNTLRQRTSVEGLAGLRKNLSPVLGMSQQEHQIAHDWRAEVDAVFYPSRSTPPESQRGSYPPWCWRRIDVAGPQPWRGKMMGEQLGIQVYREDVTTNGFLIHPRAWYEAAKLQWSFERVRPGATRNIDSVAMRAAAERGDVIDFGDDDEAMVEDGEFHEEQVALALLNSILNLFKAGVLQRDVSSYELDYVHRCLQASGSPWTRADVQQTLRAYCNLPRSGRLKTSSFVALWPPNAWEA